MILALLIGILFTPVTGNAVDLRRVSSSSCRSIDIHLGLGMTTQIILEQEPKVTLFADKKHFKVLTNSSSPRSVAIIPVFEPGELDVFRDGKGQLPSPLALAAALDKNFRTNLFVFFDHDNQLMFRLRFNEKDKADNIVKVSEVFNGDCSL